MGYVIEFINAQTGDVIDFIEFYSQHPPLISDATYRENVRGYAQAHARNQKADILIRWGTNEEGENEPDTLVTIEEAWS